MVRAYSLAVVLCSGYKPTDHPTGYSHTAATRLPNPSKVLALSHRLKNVLIENMDAVRLLSEYVRCGVVYVDPPYDTPGTNSYSATMDVGALGEVIADHPAKICISGYGDTWDHLGWYRHERETFTPLIRPGTDADTARTEVAWTNYLAPDQQALW